MRNLVKRQVSFITNNASRWTGLKISVKVNKIRFAILNRGKTLLGSEWMIFLDPYEWANKSK